MSWLELAREAKHIVTFHAPVRTADLGGWTDTWFAGEGNVCNVAVEPGIAVTIARLYPGEALPPDLIVLQGDQIPTSCFRLSELGVSPALSPLFAPTASSPTLLTSTATTPSQPSALTAATAASHYYTVPSSPSPPSFAHPSCTTKTTESPTATTATSPLSSPHRVQPVACAPSLDPIHRAVFRHVPPPFAVSVAISTSVPPGSGLGTSAAVTVALLAALEALHGRFPDAQELAYAAHRVETGLGLQTGVQDQWAAAMGGVSLLAIQYPLLRERCTLLSEHVQAELSRRLLTVFLGMPHSSSEVHERVIAFLEGRDNSPLLNPLRQAARDSYAALLAGDMAAYGAALVANHEAQRQLSPFLISASADRVARVAACHGARGWKVNGAGGDGGSMAVLGPADEAQHAALLVALDELGRELEGEGHGRACVLPFRVARQGVHMTSYQAPSC